MAKIDKALKDIEKEVKKIIAAGDKASVTIEASRKQVEEVEL